jgi:hypothetical protein
MATASHSATGVYSRSISVIAADEFGNPPPAGEFITFRLMDGPLTGYPDQGRGVFDHRGQPTAIRRKAATPSRRRRGGSSLAGVPAANCQLVLEGGTGARVGELARHRSSPSRIC